MRRIGLVLAGALAGKQASGIMLELGPNEAKQLSAREKRESQQHAAWLKRTQKASKSREQQEFQATQKREKAALKEKQKREAAELKAKKAGASQDNHETKSSEGKAKVGVGKRLKNFWDKLTYDPEAHTTAPPTYFGLPIYYKDVLPHDFENWTSLEQQDFYYKVERWHDHETERMNAGGTCIYPKPNDKVIYMMQHGDVPTKTFSESEPDSSLWDLGKAQARNVKYDPVMARGLGPNPKQRVSLVLMSPAKKTMETGILGFAGHVPNATFLVDRDLRGLAVEGAIKKAEGRELLEGFVKNGTHVAKDLLEQYTSFPSGWTHEHSSHSDRYDNLITDLLERPERHIAIIGHHMMLRQAEVELKSGEIRVMALGPNGKFRKLSQPDCWPEEF